MFRSKLNKGKFAKSFRRGISKTKRINLAPPPMRGGIRL